MDVEDILWGHTRQVSGGGRAEAAARPRPWRCCDRGRPRRPASWKRPERRRVAALGARRGGRAVLLPSTPRDAALGAGLRPGGQRACASSRRRRPHSLPAPRGDAGRGAHAGGCSARGGTPLRDLSRGPGASEGGSTSSCPAHPLVPIAGSPPARRLLSDYSHLDQIPPAPPAPSRDPPRFQIKSESRLNRVKSWI